MTRPLIALALLGVVGCAPPTPPDKVTQSITIEIWIDPLTTCHYVHRYNGGITPRLSPDGTQICERPEGQKEE
jgi:hypothetical protein